MKADAEALYRQQPVAALPRPGRRPGQEAAPARHLHPRRQERQAKAQLHAQPGLGRFLAHRERVGQAPRRRDVHRRRLLPRPRPAALTRVSGSSVL
jgi:hypothetical protein